MNVNEKSEQYAIEKHGRSATGGIDRVNSAHDFAAGYDFAMAQPKHIFDGVAVAGEVRRFDGALVDVVARDINVCDRCALDQLNYLECAFCTGCDTHNVKYIKRV